MVVNTAAADEEIHQLCRPLAPEIHDSAPNNPLYSMHIPSIDKLAAMPNILRSTSIAPKISALTIGYTPRMPPHTPSPSRPHVAHGVLVEICKSLPNLETLRLGAVEVQAVFPLPSRGVDSRDATSSYAAVLSSEVRQTPWQGTCVVVPASTTWADAARVHTLADHPIAYANLVLLNESELPENLSDVLAAGSSVMAFYGGTVGAFVAFGSLILPSLDRVLRSLTVSWTAAHALRRNSEMIKALRTGISACTQIEHLTLGLFLGSTAAVSLKHQWDAIMSLLSAANLTTLRTFTLVVTVHEDNALAEHLVVFETLEWAQAVRFLGASKRTRFAAVALKVVGARQEVEEKIRWAMELGLGHEYPVRRSREPAFVAFF